MAIAGPEYECLSLMLVPMEELMIRVFGTKVLPLHGIQNGSIGILDDEKLSNGDITHFVFLDDDAFVFKRFMMKHFP